MRATPRNLSLPAGESILDPAATDLMKFNKHTWLMRRGRRVQDVLLLDQIHYAQYYFPIGRSLVVRSHCAEAHLARRESD